MIEYGFGILLGALLDASIEFVVVGGLSATLNGAPINTFDVDVVHRRTSENVDRLIPLLESLDAVYRIQPARRLRPVRSAPLSTGRQNLLTRYGPRPAGRNRHRPGLRRTDPPLNRNADRRKRPRPHPQPGNAHRSEGTAMLPILRRTLASKSEAYTGFIVSIDQNRSCGAGDEPAAAYQAALRAVSFPWSPARRKQTGSRLSMS